MLYLELFYRYDTKIKEYRNDKSDDYSDIIEHISNLALN